MRLTFTMVLTAIIAVGCAKSESGDSTTSSAKPIASYCPYVTSQQSFDSSVTVSGKAVYEYRQNGNGEIANGGYTLTPSTTTNGQSYSLTIDSITKSWTCDQSSCSVANAVAGLSATINGDSSVSVIASGTYKLVLTPKTEGLSVTVGSLTNLTSVTNPSRKPIRHAEVRVTASDGTITQCDETDANGEFSLTLPSNSGSYTVAVASRASNDKNTAYILNNPTDNEFYTLTSTVSSSANTSGLVLVAPATDSLEGGAFNILDQILNAQEYLRTTTTGCGSTYSTCTAFTTAPVVYVYWAPGVNPGSYYGISGGISFYLNGERKLFILGGLNGDTTTTDMDHFDNSVIIHEYGHFIEDQYASPNSPGGSHNGNAVIDPRLAWGEGWANFFQAAVLNNPVYRDTYGHQDCSGSSCTGANFNVTLDPPASGYSNTDTPDSTGGAGEGNFREFSISRLLWDVVKSGGASVFAEVWTLFNGTANSLKTTTDPFKHIGRLHKFQTSLSGGADWSTLVSDESQVSDLSVYATPLTTSGCSSVAMSIRKTASDSGSFSSSDQFRNNDFYIYEHTGGNLSIGLSWTGSDTSDLDLYLYKSGYTYGNSSSMAAVSNTTTTSTSGSESINRSIDAGTYMINVMAYTGVYCNTNCSNTATASTSYTLTVNGQTVCPDP